MKCEKMHWEILEAIKDTYDDGTKEGKELIRDCLFYLKELNNFKDEKLDEQIVDWFNDNNYCIDCGCELKYYEYQEPHTELGYVCYETMGIYDCPCCGDTNNKYLREEL